MGLHVYTRGPKTLVYFSEQDLTLEQEDLILCTLAPLRGQRIFLNLAHE